MSTAEIDRMLHLPAPERLELISRLWDSLVDEGQSPSLSPAQTAELDRRLDRLERDGPGGVSWEEAKRLIKSRERSS